MDKRAHVYYSGNVQGVGFRYAALHAASAAGVTGWVRNSDDGRVEIICEGSEGRVREFLAAIEDEFRGYIADADVEWRPYLGGFNNFRIMK